ncbi:MAG: hypothetical protein IT427_15365 [Pirellulales bacterium]|nr:hypothetical protein [Pirellulales bacterium]
MTAHWFWFGLTAACVLWYSLITLYVAIKGAGDIRTMLGALRRNKAEIAHQTGDDAVRQ